MDDEGKRQVLAHEHPERRRDDRDHLQRECLALPADLDAHETCQDPDPPREEAELPAGPFRDEAPRDTTRDRDTDPCEQRGDVACPLDRRSRPRLIRLQHRGLAHWEGPSGGRIDPASVTCLWRRREVHDGIVVGRLIGHEE